MKTLEILGIMAIPTEHLVVDPSFSMRAEVSPDQRRGLVEAYAEAMRRGDVFPPLVVVQMASNRFAVLDGIYRYEAHLAANQGDAIVCEVRKANCTQDIVWFATSLNAQHGKRRSNADKRKAVTAALKHPQSKRLSLRAIARYVRVSASLVRSVYERLVQQGELPVTRWSYRPKAKPADKGAVTRSVQWENRRQRRKGKVQVCLPPDDPQLIAAELRDKLGLPLLQRVYAALVKMEQEE